jgi:hypothetical protein
MLMVCRKKTKVFPRHSDKEKQGDRITGLKGGGRDSRPGCADMQASHFEISLYRDLARMPK